MPVFFDGRTLITPTTASRVDDTQLADRNLNISNTVAYIGVSEGGKPLTALPFANPVDARNALRDGPLLDAVSRAFDPSPHDEVGAPARVVAIRVNPALPSTLTLLDADDNPVIELVTTDYGAYTAAVKVKIEDGTLSGKRVTTQIGKGYFLGDNLGRAVFSAVYAGAEASAEIIVSDAVVELQAPAGTTVATIDLGSYKTVAALVDRISATPGFSAEVLNGFDAHKTLGALDAVAGGSLLTPFEVRADLQAVVDWFNSRSEGLVDAERVAGAGAVPANIPFTFLAGGDDGTTTAQDWSDALDVLQLEDVRWITVLTADPSVHAMLGTHLDFMSTVGRKERRGFVGGDLGTSIADARTAAKLINSDRLSYVAPGRYDFDRAGELVLYPPYNTAAVVAACFAGLPPGKTMSNKGIRAQGLEYKMRNPIDTDEMIMDGVLCIEEIDAGDYRVVQAVSTWQGERKYNRVEVSVGWGYDEVSRQLRTMLDTVTRGKIGSPELLGTAYSRAASLLDQLALPEALGGPGILVGDPLSDQNPPWKNLSLNIDADVLRLQVQACVGIPINYNLITIYAVPFVGSASA